MTETSQNVKGNKVRRLRGMEVLDAMTLRHKEEVIVVTLMPKRDAEKMVIGVHLNLPDEYWDSAKFKQWLRRRKEVIEDDGIQIIGEVNFFSKDFPYNLIDDIVAPFCERKGVYLYYIVSDPEFDANI